MSAYPFKTKAKLLTRSGEQLPTPIKLPALSERFAGLDIGCEFEPAPFSRSGLPISCTSHQPPPDPRFDLCSKGRVDKTSKIARTEVLALELVAQGLDDLEVQAEGWVNVAEAVDSCCAALARSRFAAQPRSA